jgi:large subunit ribosomal protein L28
VQNAFITPYLGQLEFCNKYCIFALPKSKKMSKVCELTGKGPMFGHKVSHSNHKSNRKFLPNLKKKKFYIPELDEWIELKVSVAALRTINKKGIYAYLKELDKKGEIKLN